MNFAERNAVWDGASPREFRQMQSRGSAPRVWKLWVVGNKICSQWGQLGGAMQYAEDHMQGVNIGKKNEKSPEVYAVERARDLCRKKDWEGYREVDGAGNFLDPLVNTEINFENLPLGLCFYKPDNTLGAGLMKKAEAGKVWYSRKRNGLAFILSKGEGIPILYSRRMLQQHDDEKGTPFTWNDRFPYIIQAADAIMPPNSILLGELVVDRGGADDMPLVQSYTKSLTPQSLQDQQQYGPASFYIWDIAFWEGRNLVSEAPVRFRYELIHELDFRGNTIIPVQFFDSSYFKGPAGAVEFVKKMGWEGWVVVDPEGIYADRAFNFKGKPDRPGTACGKLKPEYEDDFVVMWDPENGFGERSTKGRSSQGIKSVGLYQYNLKGELIYIANCSSGMTDAMKKDEADPKLYPQVWRVKYTDRRYMSQGDDTNALDFPRFDEKRTDKTPAECVNPDL